MSIFFIKRKFLKKLPQSYSVKKASRNVAYEIAILQIIVDIAFIKINKAQWSRSNLSEREISLPDSPPPPLQSFHVEFGRSLCLTIPLNQISNPSQRVPSVRNGTRLLISSKISLKSNCVKGIYSFGTRNFIMMNAVYVIAQTHTYFKMERGWMKFISNICLICLGKLVWAFKNYIKHELVLSEEVKIEISGGKGLCNPEHTLQMPPRTTGRDVP